MPTLERPTVTLHYREAGSGPPLLFLHGWCDSSATWTPTIERFAGRYRCIAPDMRGHGESGRPWDHAYFPEALANDAVAICEAAGAERPVIIGHSFGGFLAAFIASRSPGFARAIVVVDQPLALGPFAAQMGAIAGVIRGRATHRGFREQLFASMMGGLEGDARAGVEARNAATPDETGLALWAPLFEYGAAEIGALSERLLGALEAQPTLVIESIESPGYEEALRAVAPGARFVRIPAGHWVHLERPEAFDAALAEFLGACGAG